MEGPPPPTGTPLQPPGPHPSSPEPLWCSLRWGRYPQLSPPLLEGVVPTAGPSPPCLMPCLPLSFCSPSGIIQRTASFLHRGTNSCSLLCSAFPWGDTAQLGWGQEACHPGHKLSPPPLAFCGGWWHTGGWGLALGAAPRAGDVPQVLLRVCRGGDGEF